MKSGTLTTSPVSIVAGLPEPVTVAPLIDGCVSATVNSTVVGTVTPITSVQMNWIFTSEFSRM